MSFFYLTSVKGDMPVHLLETTVVKRLEYMKTINAQNSTVYNEYVIEGSTYDNVGHFMMCVMVVLSENTGFAQYFLKSETELFKRRLNSLSAYDTRLFAKKLLRTIKKYEKMPDYVDALKVLCQRLMLKDKAHHICSLLHSEDCFKYKISLHFKHCLAFVAKRQVELENGNAILPCGKWKQYLNQLFLINLKYRINNCNLAPLRSDPRVMEMLKKLKYEFPIVKRTDTKCLTSKDVDFTSRFFPPCMLSLHQYLRKKHRLSHHQRFYYSLFLKDIGMGVDEAIEYWKTEYRQVANSHSCGHHWEKDEKKYLYGIRHMYGLEGCRKNYSSVGCNRVQSSDTSCSEGGCPFKSFDDQKMLSVLNLHTDISETLLSQIKDLKRKKQYTSACILYLENNLKSNCDNISFNFNPTKYFMVASKCTNSL